MTRTKKTLSGKSVVLTRTAEGIAAARKPFEDLGARVLEIPLIAVNLADEREESKEVLEGIALYDWIVFTSANGVKGFFNQFFHTYTDIRAVGPARFACVGPATIAELSQFHLACEVSPDEAQGEALARALMEFETLDNLKILVVTGNRNRDGLVTLLEEAGRAIVDILPVYETTHNDVGDIPDAERFRREGADAILFASPSAVESFVAQAKDLRINSGGKHPIACAIGPSTASALRQAGIPVVLQAESHTMDGLLSALVEKIGE